ncbi:MAG: DUF1611 domain-containing protein [Planctomycetes bacterium]|nr:DUF1611 domain-containing protein [Planctomycetota bacterium]
MHSFSSPYVVFLGDARDALAAKTGVACVQWRRELCVGQVRLPGCNADTGLPDVTIADAAARGAKTLILGLVASGGRLEASWMNVIQDALAHGLDVVSGMHDKLADVPELAAAAAKHRRRLFDIRHSPTKFATGTGAMRSGKRLLTVGTDCSCGKMFTTLFFERELRARGVPCSFRATGQTGILIAGEGVAIDAIVSDFVAGAVEALSPANAADHWDLIEGQGSLFHPAFAGVTLSLIHGAQPDVMVLCHEPGRPHVRGLSHAPMPDLRECIDLNVRVAKLTNPAARMIGVSVNTVRMDERAALTEIERIERETGLPAVDPSRHGVARVVDAMLGAPR